MGLALPSIRYFWFTLFLLTAWVPGSLAQHQLVCLNLDKWNILSKILFENQVIINQGCIDGTNASTWYVNIVHLSNFIFHNNNVCLAWEGFILYKNNQYYIYFNVLACAMRSLAIVITTVQSFSPLSSFFSSPSFAFDPLWGKLPCANFFCPNILA